MIINKKKAALIGLPSVYMSMSLISSHSNYMAVRRASIQQSAELLIRYICVFKSNFVKYRYFFKRTILFQYFFSTLHTEHNGLDTMAINIWDKLSMQLYGEITKDNDYIPLQEDESLDTSEIAEAVELFRSAVFTGYFRQDPLPYILSRFGSIMSKQIAIAFREERDATGASAGELEAKANNITESLLSSIPELKRVLSTDVKAVFDGDPAAKNYREVILCYPSMVAISNYRLAHALLGYHVPIIPRIITEMSHSKTGIDIHPGATIGEYFSIDHGTGVVIGETCIIGSHVRLYQGVTLGAKSFKFDSEGNPINEPRHPILEDNVTVYSNASILGRITIGHDSTIGGNIWQTASVPPYSKVLQGRATVSSFEDGGGI